MVRFYFCFIMLSYVLQRVTEGLNGDMVFAEDWSKFTNLANIKDWKQDGLAESIRNCFVTGNWSEPAVHGDFEDLETGEKYGDSRAEAGNDAIHKENDSLVEERRLKKLALRAKFDAEYPLWLKCFRNFFFHQ